MFVERDAWSTPEGTDPPPCFRQGDLVRVEWVLARPWLLARGAHGGTSREALLEVREEVVALVSACCDLVNHPKPKRKGVLVAPLRSMPDNIRRSAELLAALKMPVARAHEAGARIPANLFYYAQGAEHPEGVVMLESLAMLDFASLVRATKLVELTDGARVELQERIKFHFTRREP